MKVSLKRLTDTLKMFGPNWGVIDIEVYEEKYKLTLEYVSSSKQSKTIINVEIYEDDFFKKQEEKDGEYFCGDVQYSEVLKTKELLKKKIEHWISDNELTLNLIKIQFNMFAKELIVYLNDLNDKNWSKIIRFDYDDVVNKRIDLRIILMEEK